MCTAVAARSSLSAVHAWPASASRCSPAWAMRRRAAVAFLRAPTADADRLRPQRHVPRPVRPRAHGRPRRVRLLDRRPAAGPRGRGHAGAGRQAVLAAPGRRSLPPCCAPSGSTRPAAAAPAPPPSPCRWRACSTRGRARCGRRRSRPAPRSRSPLRYGRAAVLAQYLRLAPYGNGSHGIGHAARWYFDKPAADLSWARDRPARGDAAGAGAHEPAASGRPRRRDPRGARVLDALATAGRVCRRRNYRGAGAARGVQPAPGAAAAGRAAAHSAPARMARGSGRRVDPPIVGCEHRSICGCSDSVTDCCGRDLARWRDAGAQQAAVMVVRRDSRRCWRLSAPPATASRPAARSTSPGDRARPAAR